MTFEKKTTTELISLLKAGASFTLSIEDKTQTTLVSLANAANEGGGSLVLSGISGKTQTELIQIAKACPGRVTFE